MPGAVRPAGSPFLRAGRLPGASYDRPQTRPGILCYAVKARPKRRGWFFVRNVQFVRSAVRPDQYPDHPFVEAALVGRSNVGKSSLINALAGRRNVALVSSRPGRTQTVNFYSTDEGIWLVDLPGYGYADVPERVKRAFAPMIETYLNGRKQLAGIIHILDARHAPTPLDLTMQQWILARGLPVLAVATKWDKLKASEQARRRKEIEEAMGWHVVPFSATRGIGVDEVRAVCRNWARWARERGRRE